MKKHRAYLERRQVTSSGSRKKEKRRQVSLSTQVVKTAKIKYFAVKHLKALEYGVSMTPTTRNCSAFPKCFS